MSLTANAIRIKNLRCEMIKNPIGIDIKNPRLSWEISTLERGIEQKAYRIVVAKSRDDLINERNLVWDTGIVETNQTFGIEYCGESLTSKTRYFWRVYVWDNKGRVIKSDIAFWEMGLLDKSEWKAKWIEPSRPPIKEERYDTKYLATKIKQSYYSNLLPSPYFRKMFIVKNKNIKRARLYATAHGVYIVELNGERIEERLFAPDYTSYNKILQYQTYDILSLLNYGKNAIGFIVGDGWYTGKIGVLGGNCQFGNQVGLLFQLEIEYEDGEIQIVTSDERVKWKTGPIIYSDIFIGEKYDARYEMPGWSSPDYDDSDWFNVVVADYDLDNLVAQYAEPVKKKKELKPAAILTTPKGEIVIDFGQVIAGRVRMKVSGPKGTVVKLEHSEILDEYGNFVNNILGINKDQCDYYVLKGLGEEIYEPYFTFHGFRYVKVTGYPGKVTPEKFTAVVLSTNLKRTGYFKCSDNLINRLYLNIIWSQVGNQISIPTDCPQRERAGWTGDIQIFAPTACWNFDVYAFYIRWLRNLKADQFENGEVPVISPYTLDCRIIQESFGGHSSSGWSDACIIVPWVLYNVYGDVKVLEENYQMMKKWLLFLENLTEESSCYDEKNTIKARNNKDYIIKKGFHFGDWLTPSLSKSNLAEMNPFYVSMLTKDFVATCFFAYSAELFSKISNILGQKEDSKYYKELSFKIKKAFTKEFVDVNGKLKIHLQGMYVLALKFNMVPKELRKELLNNLVNLIKENNYKLDTGFLSTQYLLDVLVENGYSDIAFRILFQKECPSWLYEVEQGATTIWESWFNKTSNGKVNSCSYNHCAMGCVGDWIYRNIGGIRCDAPGYRKVIIKPLINDRITFAKTAYHSINGLILCKWKISSRMMKMQVIIPPNCMASVCLPKAKVTTVTVNKVPLTEMEGLYKITQMPNEVRIICGSGYYCFEYTLD